MGEYDCTRVKETTLGCGADCGLALGSARSFRKFFRKQGVVRDFRFPEISAEISLPKPESSNISKRNKRSSG